MAPAHPQNEGPVHPGWVRRGRLMAFGAVSAVCLLGVVLSVWSRWFVLFAVPLVPAGYITTILAASAFRLSRAGGDLQGAIHDLIVERVQLDGGSVALDVGCGSGRLAIALATTTQGVIVGIDSWGPSWEYSKLLCDRNAQREQVADRVSFQRGTGAVLDFDDAHFDAVVSCMTFHEVHDANPRIDAVVEALRVVRPGGRFVFVDPFGDDAYYRSTEAVADAVRAAGAEVTELVPLHDLLTLRFPLRHPKVLGRTMLLAGTKTTSQRPPTGPETGDPLSDV